MIANQLRQDCHRLLASGETVLRVTQGVMDEADIGPRLREISNVLRPVRMRCGDLFATGPGRLEVSERVGGPAEVGEQRAEAVLRRGQVSDLARVVRVLF